MSKKILFLFILLLALASFVVSLLISRARTVDAHYNQGNIISE